jgi:hypothetical protein
MIRDPPSGAKPMAAPGEGKESQEGQQPEPTKAQRDHADPSPGVPDGQPDQQDPEVLSMDVASAPARDPHDDLAFLRLHVEACWDVRLPALEPGEHALLPGGAEPPWAIYLAATAAGRVALWRSDVPPERRDSLLARAVAEFARAADAAKVAGVTREVVLRLVGPRARGCPAARVGERELESGRPPRAGVPQATVVRLLTAADAALFAAFDPADPQYYVRPEVSPVLGAVVAGRLVSVAHSSRRTPHACELGVDTRPEARQRGYGLAVTVSWTTTVCAEGLTPIYSALASNAASLALAHAAGYRPVARAAYIAELSD